MAFTFSPSSLRFEDIRNGIVEFLKENNQYSANFDFQGSNLAYIIDSMAYTCTILSYQLANVSQDHFLDSTELRKSSVSIAKTMGYKPKRAVSSQFVGTLKYYGENFNESSQILIPVGSHFISNSGRIYINHDPIILKYSGDPTYISGEYVLNEGVEKTFETFGTGKPLQSFVINNPNIENNSLKIYVKDTNSTSYFKQEYKLVKTFHEVVEKNVYFLEEDIVSIGCPKIVFGNGIIGNIPKTTDTIICEFLETVGSSANGEYLSQLPTERENYVISNDIASSFQIENFDPNYKNENNKSFGGTDLEEVDGIKDTAPRYFSSVGRLVTKNDYYSFIYENYPQIQSVNIIGGEEYLLDEGSNLGNVYLTAIPKLPLDFNIAQRIYLTELQENKILFDLLQRSIISTRRKFYKPSYIFLDVFPSIELKSNISVSEKNYLLSYSRTNLISFFSEYFSTLGQQFRLSKLISVLDQHSDVISSQIELVYYFIISYDSFYNVSSLVNSNNIFLPVIADKDDVGNIVKYRNFIKTNVEIVDEKIFQDSAIVMSQYEAEFGLIEANKKRYLELLKLKPEDSSIYGKLTHENLDRYLYNVDYSLIDLFKIVIENGNIFSTNYVFFDADGNIISTKLSKRPDDDYDIIFIKNGVEYIVGLMSVTVLNELNIITYPEELEIFGIIQDNEINPIVQIKDGEYYFIKLKVIANKSFCEVRLLGETKCISLDLDQVNPTKRFVNSRIFTVQGTNKQIEGKQEQSGTDIISKLSVENSDIALINKNDNYKFKGYITNNIELYSVIMNSQSLVFSDGDYYIFSRRLNSDSFVFEELIGGVNVKLTFDDDDIIYFDDSAPSYFEKWKKINFLGEIDAQKSSSLLSQNDHGDIYKISVADLLIGSNFDGKMTENVFIDDLIFFNENSVTNPIYKFERCEIIGDIDASKNYPIEVSANMVKLVVNTDVPTNFGGQTSESFIKNDLIIYNETLPIPDRWTKLCNTEILTGIPTISAIFSVPDTTGLNYGDLFLVSDNGNFGGYDKITWSFENVQKIAFSGDILIYIGNDEFVLFDHNYSFNIDGSTENSLPIPLNYGDVFNCIIAGDFNGNSFDYFDIGDQLVYMGESEWKKVVILNDLDATYDSLPKIANLGDSIKIFNEGDFENSTLLYGDNKFSTYHDQLVFLGDMWYKINKYTIVLTDEGKTFLTNLGVQRGIEAKYNPDSFYYDLYLYDFFTGSKIGSFNYLSGKMTFESKIEGYYAKDEKIPMTFKGTFLKNFFNNYNGDVKFDKIRMLSINKLDKSGNKLGDYETDFDTLFNQYIVSSINPVTQLFEV